MITLSKPICHAALVVTLAVAASTASAKGHSNGFGAGIAGQDTAGLVDDGQSNREFRSPETSYGLSDAILEAMDGIPGNSIAAKDKLTNHPSLRAGRGE